MHMKVGDEIKIKFRKQTRTGTKCDRNNACQCKDWKALWQIPK